MASLGAVYGISFVAGSLASMGSAYMASKIYPIEDDVPPIEQPYVDNSPVIASPPSLEGGMRGGDRKSDLEDLVKKYDAFVVEAANKNWTEVRKLKRSFAGKAVQLKITDAVEASKALEAAITARTSTPPAKDANSKETDSNTKLTDLYETIKNELASGPASSAVVISSSVKPVSYTSLAVATDNNLSGFHFARTSDGTKGLVLTSFSDTPIASVTYPFGDKTKFAVTNTYGLKVVSVKDQATTYNAKVVEVDSKKDTSNIFILTNPEDLPDGKQLAVYGSKTLDNWSTPKTPDQNAIKSAKSELEKSGVALDTAVKKAIDAGATKADIVGALPAAVPAAPGDVPVLDFDKRIDAAITNAKKPAVVAASPDPKIIALAEIPTVVNAYKTKYSDLKRLTDLKRVTIKDDATKLKGTLDASYSGTYKKYLMRGESTLDFASEDKGGPVGIEDDNKFILVAIVTDIADPRNPIFTTVSQFIPTLKQFPIKLAKYDKVTDNYVYDNVKYIAPAIIPAAPVAPAAAAAAAAVPPEITEIYNEQTPEKQKTLIKSYLAVPGNTKDTFLTDYVAKMKTAGNDANPLPIELSDLFISEDLTMTGGHRGGTMADYAGIDIISGIVEINERQRAHVKSKYESVIQKLEEISKAAKTNITIENASRILTPIAQGFIAAVGFFVTTISKLASSAWNYGLLTGFLRIMGEFFTGLADWSTNHGIPALRSQLTAFSKMINDAAMFFSAAGEAVPANEEAAPLAPPANEQNDTRVNRLVKYATDLNTSITEWYATTSESTTRVKESIINGMTGALNSFISGLDRSSQAVSALSSQSMLALRELLGGIAAAISSSLSSVVSQVVPQNIPSLIGVIRSASDQLRTLFVKQPTSINHIDVIEGDEEVSEEAPEGGSRKQRGGALDRKLYKLIENGPFVNGKSVITWEVLQKIENLIIVFYGPFVMPDYSGDYNTELLKINKERAAKILTVQSWLRTVPKKTNISKSYIEKIVPDSLSFKQFIDILADMVQIDSTTKKPNIQIAKDIFDSESDLVRPTYLITTSSPIYKLTRLLVVRKNDIAKVLTTSNLSYVGKIEIKHIIKYFEDGGDLYTFFRFKNVLRVIYDFSFGDKDYDKVFINLSKIITWLTALKSSAKITNTDIETFKAANPRTPMSVLVDTLAFLIKEKIQIKNTIIRVTDFNCIETLDEDNVDINTKIIKAIIDPAQITLPKPTAVQIQKLEAASGKSPIEPNDLILASLFVGSIELPSSPTISGLGDVSITSFSDPSRDGVQTVTFTGSNSSLKIDVRVTITGATESSNNILNAPILSVSKKTFTIKNKTGVEEDNVTAKATLSRALPPDATSVIGMLDQIQNAIDKRKEADILASMTRSEYKTGETVKQAKVYMKGTESEKERKMMEESLRKDEMIKQLEETRAEYEKDTKLQAEAKAKFDEKLKKVVAVNKLKELESLLKERDAELAKEYERVKSNENDGSGPIKPVALSDDTWNKLRSQVGPVKDSLDLIPIITQFNNDNPGVDVAPYETVERMIRRIYEGKKKNKGNKTDKNFNRGGTPSCSDVSGRPPCIRKDGSLNAAGGYHQTLRNHLRSRRFTRRHL